MYMVYKNIEGGAFPPSIKNLAGSFSGNAVEVRDTKRTEFLRKRTQIPGGTLYRVIQIRPILKRNTHCFPSDCRKRGHLMRKHSLNDRAFGERLLLHTVSRIFFDETQCHRHFLGRPGKFAIPCTSTEFAAQNARERARATIVHSNFLFSGNKCINSLLQVCRKFFVVPQIYPNHMNLAPLW